MPRAISAISAWPKRIPMHVREPPPNGTYAPGASFALFSSLKRCGRNISGSDHTSGQVVAGPRAVLDVRVRRGIRSGLGTDGAASNNDLDMFEAVRTAALLHKHASGDPRVLPARQALELATSRGAAALGLEGKIGTLKPGKLADVITISTTSARQTPMFDPLSHLVYVTRGTDVRTTVVNGRVLMREGRVLTLDRTTVIKEANAMAGKVRAAVQGAGQ